jgi:hypothetical protein
VRGPTADGRSRVTGSLSQLATSGDPGVRGNERLTALAGTVLLALIVVQIVTVVRLRAFMDVHILVGVLLAGPLALKLASTGYRFARYYTHAPPYVRGGPPRPPLRLLAPFLAALTVVVIGSGMGLALVGPAKAGPLLTLHNLSALVWFPLIALHAVAYAVRALRLAAADTIGRLPMPGGRGLRLAANGLALGLGVAGAVVLLPDAGPWATWSQVTESVPAPLIVGVVLSVIALLVARPRRWT